WARWVGAPSLDPLRASASARPSRAKIIFICSTNANAPFVSPGAVSSTRRTLRLTLLALLAAATTMSARSARADGPPPERLPYVAGQPAPSGYHVEQRVKPWLPVAGGFLLGAFYALAAGSEAFGRGQCSTDKWLYLPVAGPFVAASYRG